MNTDENIPGGETVIIFSNATVTMLTDHEKHYSKQDDLVDEKCAENNENHKDNFEKTDQKLTGSIFFKKKYSLV